jgi:uncharacterized protein YoxC
MEEILKTGFSFITAGILSAGLVVVVALLIVFGILNRTLYQIKETLDNIQKNLECQSNKQEKIYNRNEE